jgi:hypothetical protein
MEKQNSHTTAASADQPRCRRNDRQAIASVHVESHVKSSKLLQRLKMASLHQAMNIARRSWSIVIGTFRTHAILDVSSRRLRFVGICC